MKMRLPFWWFVAVGLVGCQASGIPFGGDPAQSGVVGPSDSPPVSRGTRRHAKSDLLVETILHSFNGTTDTAYPDGPPFVGPAGDVFGTSVGGAGGTVFRYATDGTLTILHRFSSGASPMGGVIRDSSGNLYGTTLFGGAHGEGSVFRLSNSGSTWTLTNLHSFNNFSNGWQPTSGLVMDSTGSLYGTTSYGGKAGPYSSGIYCPVNGEDAYDTGCGVVFKLTPTASTYTYSVIYRFTGKSDGFYPSGVLALDVDGNIFGTTGYGGIYGATTPCGNPGSPSYSQYYGCGTIFKLSPSGSTYSKSTLYEFQGSTADGANPFGGITASTSVGSTLYGTTSAGGNANCGSVFSISPSGTSETTLHNFDCAKSDVSGAILSGGELYTSVNTSSNCCGAVFQTNASTGATSKSYGFSGNPDGKYPTTPFLYLPARGYVPATGRMAVDGSGNIYGFTAYGGGSSTYCSAGCGTIFELSASSARPHHRR